MVWKAINTAPGWQEWENDSKKPIAGLRIFSNIAFEVKFETKEEGRAFLKLFKGTGIPVHFRDNTGSLDHTVVIEQKTPYLNDFFRRLLQFDPSIQSVLPVILKQLNLSQTLGLNLSEISQLPKKEAISLVIEAQSHGAYDLIWELFKRYDDDFIPQEGPNGEVIPAQNKAEITLKDLYELANSIVPNNPHYQEAQLECVHLLMRVDIPDNADEDQLYADLELKFKHAVLGNDPTLTDQLFAQLCGLRFGDPHTQNIKPNVETLCLLAKVIREINHKPENTVITSPRFFKS